MVNNSLFIFGLGFAASEVAREALRQGYKVSGTCRSSEKCERLKQQGIDAMLFSKVTSEITNDYQYILSSIPLQETGDPVIPLLPTNHWLGYFSTTGIYGDYAGGWVDETSDPRPTNKRLLRRLVAEAQWKVRGGHIFRLAGIYGKGRSVIDDVLDGSARRIDKKDQVFSRIHIEDIAQTVLASMHKPNKGAVYNVCDNEPAPAHEVVKFACELLNKPVPPLLPYDQVEMSAMGREFYSANRRVSNKKIREELGVELRYPTYREGLKSLLT